MCKLYIPKPLELCQDQIGREICRNVGFAEMWDSLGVNSSNSRYLRAAERFIKDTIEHEV